MDERELENNLGIIANSGSLKFRREMTGDESGEAESEESLAEKTEAGEVQSPEKRQIKYYRKQ